MKPDDVTDAMALSFREGLPRMSLQHTPTTEIIAAAFNAVTSDDSPITAEWLLANGYKRYRAYDVYELDRIRVWMPGGPTVYYNDSKVPTETIGQLRALHAGLGIGEVEGE